MKKYLTITLLLTLVVSTCFCQTTDDEKYEQANKYYEAKEYNKAISMLNELVERNHAKALNLLGVCYETGRGVTKDYKKSFEYYQKSANYGWAPAQCNLGFCYEYGQGVSKDYNKAYALYKKAVDQGNARGQNNLGCLYLKGLGVTQDYKKAYELFQEAAKKDEYNALGNLGYLYSNGYGVNKDTDIAIEYYIKAAEKDITFAMVNLGWLYIENEDYKNKHPEYSWDYCDKQAEKWFRLASKQNNPDGIYGLAWLYYTMPSPYNPNDPWERVNKSFPLFEKAAKMGQGNAQLFMGFQEMKKNRNDSALYWFKQAEINKAGEIYGLSSKAGQIVSKFFINNPQYRLFDGDDILIYPDNDGYCLGAILKGKLGFIIISNAGKTIAHTPFIYESESDVTWPSYDKGEKLFHVTLKKEGEEYGQNITIDITGKEIITKE